VWSSDDQVITIHLPRRPRRPASSDNPGEPAIDLHTRLADGEAPTRTFLEMGGEAVRVGGVRLPRRPAGLGPLVPSLEAFDHFCIDETTAATLEHLAVGVLLREPCLLEGETSTSKTSAILYLAALLRQPVVRLNLNGQTDTGELIGRFVPRSEEEEDKLTGWQGFDDKVTEWQGDRVIEDSPVTLSPCRPVTLSSSLWRWQDGLVVQAIKHGWWVLLDEVNLAEPQILERLNSVLEVDPALVLTEHENEQVSPIHPCFRLFATMNPAEYAGRCILSPAYRDRWRGYRFVPRPGEREYLAMLRLLIHGEQPAAVVQGRRYHGERTVPRYPTLASVLTAPLLVGLARFQSALEHAAGRGGEAPRLGVRRKERHVFTRRSLLSVLDYLASPLGLAAQTGDRSVRAALLRYYLGRVSAPEDQAMVVQLLDAAGIGPRSWGGQA
jgi:MoxR-like ATPase